MRLKTILSAAGAVGIAGALGFGAAIPAHALSDASDRASDVTEARVQGPFNTWSGLTDVGNGPWNAWGVSSSGSPLQAITQSTGTEPAGGAEYTFPAVGGTAGPISPVSAPGTCLTATGNSASDGQWRDRIYLRPCSGAASQQWRILANGVIKSSLGYGFSDWRALGNQAFGIPKGSEHADEVLVTSGLSPVVEVADLTADVVSRNESDRTGVVGGKGEPGAELDITNPDGTTQQVTVGENGEWTATIPNLKTGSNPVKVVQKVGDDEQEANVDISMNAAKLTADVKSVDTEAKTGVVGGKGEPGAELDITNPDGTLQQVTVGENGEWTATIPNLKTGSNPVKVVQKVGDDEQEANVDITMEATKMSAEVISVDAGDKTAVVGGKGEPGEKLEITNPDGTTQEVVIGDNGEWTATVPGLQEGENPIKVKQPSTGDEIDLVATLLPSPIVDPAIAGGAGLAAIAALGTVLLVRRGNTVKQ